MEGCCIVLFGRVGDEVIELLRELGERGARIIVVESDGEPELWVPPALYRSNEIRIVLEQMVRRRGARS